MSPESPVITREFLEAIGGIRSDIREIKNELGHVGATQEKQWERIDDEVKQRQAVDAQLISRIDHIDGAKGALKYVAPFIWAVVFLMMGWAAKEMLALRDNVLVLQNTNISPEGWQEVLASQQLIRDMKVAQDRMQADIDGLKETSQKIVDKPIPKIPAPVYKTTIVPAPKDYTFERLIKESDLPVDKPKKGRPR